MPVVLHHAALCRAAYNQLVLLHKVSRIPKWQPKGVLPETRTAINTEWGCYCSNLLPRVKEDLELDAASGAQQGMWRGAVALLLLAGMRGYASIRR